MTTVDQIALCAALCPETSMQTHGTTMRFAAPRISSAAQRAGDSWR
jgi:hypothetical protein